MQSREMFEANLDDFEQEENENEVSHSLTYYNEEAKKAPNYVDMDPNEAYRDPSRVFMEVNWTPCQEVLQETILCLNDLTKTRIHHFYPEQYNGIMNTLKRAFFQNINDSLLLLARSK